MPALQNVKVEHRPDGSVALVFNPHERLYNTTDKDTGADKSCVVASGRTEVQSGDHMVTVIMNAFIPLADKRKASRKPPSIAPGPVRRIK